MTYHIFRNQGRGRFFLSLAASLLLFTVASCDLYSCLYGDASIVIINESGTDITSISLFDSSNALVTTDSRPLPNGANRELSGLDRKRYQLVILLPGYAELSESVDLSDLDRCEVKVVHP